MENVINPSTGTENNEVREDNGTVYVCLSKNQSTAIDFLVMFTAQQKTPTDAICKNYKVKVYKYGLSMVCESNVHVKCRSLPKL